MKKKELITLIEADVFVERMVERQPYSFCELSYGYKDVDYTGYGFSKVCHPDKWDAELGMLKARQRAISDIYQQIKAAE
jgi:hypothetical protein